MKVRTKTERKFAIFCFSDMQGDYAPTLWPKHALKPDAEQFARENVRHTKYEVRPVLVTENVPQTPVKPRYTVEATLRALLVGERIPVEILDATTGEILAPKNQRLQRFHVKRVIAKRDRLDIEASPLRTRVLSILHR